MHVGVSALVRSKGSLGRETKPIHFEAETERLLQRYIRTDRATHDLTAAACWRGWMTLIRSFSPAAAANSAMPHFDAAGPLFAPAWNVASAMLPCDCPTCTPI